MANFFSDKVALITGGSRGLGLQIARELCGRGAKVSLLARDAEELERAKAQLDAFKTEVLTVQCDLVESQQIQSAVQQTFQRFGKIDILINNAGIIEVGPIEHSQLKDFDRNMRIHFWAPYILQLLILPQMRVKGGGRIVNISSIGGRIGIPHMAAYCASKFALTGFSDAARCELARDNIFVTTVTPGLMRTGSDVHAMFKGDHAAEYSWFRRSLKIPFASISVERAARKIVNACRSGRPSLVMPFSTYLAIAKNALFPNLFARVMIFINRMLPRRVSQEGNESRSGLAIRAGK
ncbi:MAG TPA: SDR family oxidoreductase [Chthoniobacterales bacterium]|jgi:short-subunit dehydrogenase|nr:SDR family oxidoreductase [Chthoniobacterales bacterium]